VLAEWAAIPGASLVAADCPGFCSSSITEGICIVSRIKTIRERKENERRARWE